MTMRTKWLVAAALALLACASLAAAQEDAAAAPPALVLLPPEDTSVCSKEAFHHFTKHYSSCAKSIWAYDDPDTDCCEGFAFYYGPNSTRPTRNCYCDADVWAELNKHNHYYDFASALLMCANKGYIVGFNAEEGVGYCYGVPPSPEELAEAHVSHTNEPVMGPSVQDYFKRMDQDHLVAFSFATGIISGVGVLIALWPLVWEATIQALAFAKGK